MIDFRLVEIEDRGGLSCPLGKEATIHTNRVARSMVRRPPGND